MKYINCVYAVNLILKFLLLNGNRIKQYSFYKKRQLCEGVKVNISLLSKSYKNYPNLLNNEQTKYKICVIGTFNSESQIEFMKKL